MVLAPGAFIILGLHDLGPANLDSGYVEES